MLYVDFHAGDKDYKLRLNTRSIAVLEKQIGFNPLGLFRANGTLPTVTEMVSVLYCSMLQLNHGVSLDDAYDIFETWLNEDDHVATDFLDILVEIYEVSGLLKKGSTKKNA